jgi:hypothetical protein
LFRKKILEEKYINDYQSEIKEGCNQNADNLLQFPRPVVKIIAESPVFAYPELLPSRYGQRSDVQNNFMLSEDILIVYGYEDLKNSTRLASHSKATAIANVLLPTRTPVAVLNRLKNIKKTSSTASQVIKVACPWASIPSNDLQVG